MAQKSVKAYKNLEFLNSPEARLIRILTEYLEPRRRFKQHKVKDTIVFFGSSRIISEAEAKDQFDKTKNAYDSDPSAGNERKYRIAQKHVEMSRFYEDARTLARLMTEWSMNLGNNHRRYLIVSGGGPGIMEAANRGALEVEG
jgi:predicted Rossmann-fold nucleotide-binding protein